MVFFTLFPMLKYSSRHNVIKITAMPTYLNILGEPSKNGDCVAWDRPNSIDIWHAINCDYAQFFLCKRNALKSATIILSNKYGTLALQRTILKTLREKLLVPTTLKITPTYKDGIISSGSRIKKEFYWTSRIFKPKKTGIL